MTPILRFTPPAAALLGTALLSLTAAFALLRDPLSPVPIRRGETGGYSAGAGEFGRIYVRSVSRWNLSQFLWALSTHKDGETVRSICPGDCLHLTYLVVIERPADAP